MNDNHWYPAYNQDYRRLYNPPDPSLGSVAANSVQDAHRLLAAYPFASATPTTHGLFGVCLTYAHTLSFNQLQDTSAI
jgi:hypothetical protein